MTLSLPGWIIAPGVVAFSLQAIDAAPPGLAVRSETERLIAAVAALVLACAKAFELIVRTHRRRRARKERTRDR